jgi:mannose/fructose/N-acetylgalactosamine-specific phosphotransferase system component IID
VRAQSSPTLEGALIVVLLALAGGLLYLVEITRPTADALMPFLLLLVAAIAVFWRLRRWPARPWFVVVMFLILGIAGYGIWLLWYTTSRVPVAV